MVALLLLALTTVFDQISKYLVLTHLKAGAEKVLVPGFFSLIHVKNKGAAFGMLANTTWGSKVLLFLTVILTAILLFIFTKTKVQSLRLGLALVIGGSIGNIIDRLIWTEVTDFLSFRFGSYFFPTFNLADTAIVLGGVLLAILIILRPSLIDEFFVIKGGSDANSKSC